MRDSDSRLMALLKANAREPVASLARKLNPRYDWDDIVLPRLQMSTLKMISTTIRQRPVV